VTRNASSPRGEVGVPPHVLAFGGGKGGVGKSVIAANVAVRLARAERRVVVIDTDLGGANLHTILGVANPERNLCDFLGRRAQHLQEVETRTSVPRLSLIACTDTPMSMVTPNHAQKERLLRQITQLKAEFVVIDLGAGVTLKVLDFFLAAHQGVVVVVPEPTAIENAYHFLRAAFFRKITREAQRYRLGKVVDDAAKAESDHGIPAPRTIIDSIWKADPEVGQAVEKAVAGLAPGIVVNRIMTPADRSLGDDLGLVCRDYFDTPITYLCAVDQDPNVPLSIRQRQPAVEGFPECPFSRAVERLTQRLLARSEDQHGG